MKLKYLNSSLSHAISNFTDENRNKSRDTKLSWRKLKGSLREEESQAIPTTSKGTHLKTHFSAEVDETESQNVAVAEVNQKSNTSVRNADTSGGFSARARKLLQRIEIFKETKTSSASGSLAKEESSESLKSAKSFWKQRDRLSNKGLESSSRVHADSSLTSKNISVIPETSYKSFGSTSKRKNSFGGIFAITKSVVNIEGSKSKPGFSAKSLPRATSKDASEITETTKKLFDGKQY